MSRTAKRRAYLAAGVAALLACTLTACTVSAAGGIVGGLGALSFVVILLAGGSAQSGCGPTYTACLSPVPVPPDDAGPIQNIVPPEDAGAPMPDAYEDVGPCLDIGPCLQPVLLPCLYMDSMDGEPGAFEPIAPQRASSLDRLVDRLPPDVIERLRGGTKP